MTAKELASRICCQRGVDVSKYHQFIQERAEDCGLRVNSYPLDYPSGRIKLLEITSGLKNHQPVFIQTSGFHGNETHAFLSTAVNLPCLAREARLLGIGLVVYPLVNPLGASCGLRYNPDDDPPGIANNDFIRYQLKDGNVVDDLGKNTEFNHWSWAIDMSDRLPPETRFLSQRLKTVFSGRQVVALLDNHTDLKIGDPATDVDGPASYSYVFHDPQRYLHISRLAEIFVPPWNRKAVSSELNELKTNENGFIKNRRDGSIIDLADRLGIEAVTVEVSGDTDFDDAAMVYASWAQGLLGLVAKV